MIDRATPSLVLADGRAIPVIVRRSARARRLAVRLGAAGDSVTLVLPQRAALAQGMAFLDSQRTWIADRLGALPPRIAFVEGAVIPVLGIERQLALLGPGRGQAPPFRVTATAIEVTGDAARLARRTRTGLTDLAAALLGRKTRALAQALDRKVGLVSVGDPRSRWGSCAGSGNIRYSWRLVLAPELVMDYVVAHEVAHLAERHHGPGFWALVEHLAPGHGAQRAWLKRHGARLFRYG